jgi:hypothetical protein
MVNSETGRKREWNSTKDKKDEAGNTKNSEKQNNVDTVEKYKESGTGRKSKSKWDTEQKRGTAQKIKKVKQAVGETAATAIQNKRSRN